MIVAENESSRGLESYKNLLKDGFGKSLPDDSATVGTPQSTIDFNATEPGRRSREEILLPAGQPNDPTQESDAERE
jgi:hypothetical protein